jgi:hypothetical protein
LVEIKPLDFTTSEDGEAVKSALLRLRVTVPTTFAIDPNLGWNSVSCPDNRWLSCLLATVVSQLAATILMSSLSEVGTAAT